MGLNREFWSGKKVLLTGHTGFKGAWLSLWLRRLGAEVVGLSLPPDQKPNLFSLLDAPSQHTFGDIRDKRVVHEVMSIHQPDLVMHLAAQALVRQSYREPEMTFETNLMGTLHLLEAVRTAPAVKAVLVVTTDKCYRNHEHGSAFKESDPLGGNDPYSASKACAEILCWSYKSSFFQDKPRLATARAGNVIGGGDWATERLIPDMVRAVFAAEPLQIRHPEAIRPWQHVLEPLYGYLLLMQSLMQRGETFSEAWNFGPPPEAVSTVRDLVSQVLKDGDDSISVFKGSPNMKEAHTLLLDSDKANQRLKWSPRLDLSATMKWTWDWYTAYYQGQDMQAFSLQQIKDYEALWNH